MAGRWTPRARRAPVLLAVVAAAVLVLGTGGSRSGWAAAGVANGTDSARVASVAVTHAYASATCSTGARVGTVTCAPTLGTQGSPPATTGDTITNTGDLAVTGSVKAASCAPVQLGNAQQATDPMLPRNAVTFRQPDPWGSTSAAALTGSGYATDIVGTTGSGLLGALQRSNSIGVWFKAADTAGGGLLSLDASLSNATSASGDPMLWLDGAGKVHFSGSGSLGPIQGTSTHAFTTGWHLAVLTVNTTGTLTLTKALTLYVDGQQEATGSGLTLLTGSSGYWHLGWADFTGLSAPSSSSFHGALSGAFVDPSTALTAGQVSTLFAQTSAAGYQATAVTQGAGSVWMLADDGVSTYAGALPGTEASPCAKVSVSLTLTNPAVAIGPLPLATFADGTSRGTGTLPSGQSQGLTIATAQGSGYSTDLAGLHLYVPITFTYTAVGWTQSLVWSGDPTEVFRG